VPKWAHDFLIENDTPKKLDEKKPTQSVQAAKAIKRAKLN